MGTLDKALDQLGAAGFEMCGWASADKTIGFNGFVGIFKRPTAAPGTLPPTVGWTS
jgi:hypothetical protein